MGDACHDCFDTYTRGFSDDCKSFDDFAERYKQSKTFRAEVAAAMLVKNGGEKPFKAEKVEKVLGTTYTIQRHVVIMTEKELRHELGVPRLTADITKTLPQMSVPSEADSTLAEQVFVFADSDKPHRSLTIATTIGVTASTESLPSTSHLWAGQSARCLHREAQKVKEETSHSTLLDKYTTHSMTTMAEFCDKFASKKRRRSNMSEAETTGSNEEEQEEWATSTEFAEDIVGIGAKHIVATSNPNNAIVDLISPGAKPRPAVPPFHEEPAKGGPSQDCKTPTSPATSTLQRGKSSSNLGEGDTDVGSVFSSDDFAPEVCEGDLVVLC